MNEHHKQALGNRLRTIRTRQGITQTIAARTIGVGITSWQAWERGAKAYHAWRAVDIARALDVPVKQLFVDDEVLVEVELSPATLADVRDRGDEAVQDALARLNTRLGPLVVKAATRKPDSPRARPRRSRAAKLVIPKSQPQRREIT